MHNGFDLSSVSWHSHGGSSIMGDSAVYHSVPVRSILEHKGMPWLIRSNLSKDQFSSVWKLPRSYIEPAGTFCCSCVFSVSTLHPTMGCRADTRRQECHDLDHWLTCLLNMWLTHIFVGVKASIQPCQGPHQPCGHCCNSCCHTPCFCWFVLCGPLY